MNSSQIIMIVVAVIGVGAFGYLRSDKNEYSEREVGLDSPEAKAALAIIEKLAQSTNYLAQCISPKASPAVQKQLIRSAIQLRESGEVLFTDAQWTGDYLKIQVRARGNIHCFTLEPEVEGGLKLLGVL